MKNELRDLRESHRELLARGLFHRLGEVAPVDRREPIEDMQRVRARVRQLMSGWSGQHVRMRKVTRAVKIPSALACNGFVGACRRQTPHPIPLPQGERGLS